MDRNNTVFEDKNRLLEVNKAIIKSFLKGFYTISPFLGSVDIPSEIHYIKPERVCVCRYNYYGYPMDGATGSDIKTPCIGDFDGESIYYLSRLQDYGVTWWLTKPEAEAALEALKQPKID